MCFGQRFRSINGVLKGAFHISSSPSDSLTKYQVVLRSRTQTFILIWETCYSGSYYNHSIHNFSRNSNPPILHKPATHPRDRPHVPFISEKGPKKNHRKKRRRSERRKKKTQVSLNIPPASLILNPPSLLQARPQPIITQAATLRINHPPIRRPPLHHAHHQRLFSRHHQAHQPVDHAAAKAACLYRHIGRCG